jgi:cyclopropane-fatty-acyl-phospholipid synthase
MGISNERLARVLSDRFAAYFADGPGTAFAVRTPDGATRGYGSGPPAFTLRVHNERGVRALAGLDLAEAAGAYVLGDIDVDGDVVALIEMRAFFGDRNPLRFAWRFARPLLLGQVRSDREWIAFHYDEDPEFYLQFLDARHRCYSQGIFERDDEPLEDAISRKLEFALEAIGAREGDHVLDIGGGWGSFVEFAGRRGIRVTSLTISRASEAFMRALIERERLPCEVRLEHLFEHAPPERYDAIVNLGVTEHLPHYRATLRKYGSLLRPGGRIYLDASAARRKHSQPTFTERFIYPGNGSLLCLHEYLEELARTPLRLEGVYDDRHSYYLTARAWAERLDRARGTIEERWGRAVHRRFQLFLWGTASSFRLDRSQAYRVVLSAPP